MAGQRRAAYAFAIGLLGCLASVCTVAASEAPSRTSPARLLDAIRSARLQPAGSVAVEDVRLRLGPARLELERGVLVPVRTPSGRRIEAVFLGRARFRVEPPDEVEAGQLLLFTGERSVDAVVTEAVIVLSRPGQLEALFDASPLRLDPVRSARAREIHSSWIESTERRHAAVVPSMLRARLGEAGFEEHVTVWARSERLGTFVYQIDPSDIEPVKLGSFKPLEMTTWDRLRRRRHFRLMQRKGRWLDRRIEDVGSWDVWLSMPWSPTVAAPGFGSDGFESRHYELDVRIAKRRKNLGASGTIHIEAIAGGRRVVRLNLLSDLAVQWVRDADGKQLYAHRDGEDVYVVLPRAPVAGERLALRAAWGGRALNWVGGKSFDLEDTSLWYPNCGVVDRATYDVRVRWPAGLRIAASGKLESGGREGDRRWEHRTIDRPSLAFSFVLGDFVIERRRVGHVDVEMAFHRDRDVRMSAELRDRMFRTVARSLEFFEATFGPYPLDYLTVATIPRSSSQSFLGFVTLAGSIIEQSGVGSSDWVRDTTIAHELAHQWWGNVIGWRSYRDHWLSEGMANYSALLFEESQSRDGASLLAVMSAGWRHSLVERTSSGRTIESLGPITLGVRLNSSLDRDAYRAIIYRKGAVVLAMLARAVGEEQFLSMLRSFVDAASDRVLRTETFLAALERMSGLDLDGFARQYVYGTGIPRVYYDWSVERGDAGGWRVTGEARLRRTSGWRHRAVRRGDGWDVLREISPEASPVRTTLMVPYRATIGSAAGRRRIEGRVFIEGRRDRFEVELAGAPDDFRLDPRGEVLAWFYSRQANPKRVLRYEASDLALEGRRDEAERRLRDALDAPVRRRRDVDPLRPGTEPAPEGEVEDARIRLDLVRLLLDLDRDAEAREALELVEAFFGAQSLALRVERDGLAARLDVRAGRHRAAHDRLRRILRQAMPRRPQASWGDRVRTQRLIADRAALAEAFALLAVTAYEIDRPGDLAWAVGKARELGADVEALGGRVAVAGVP